MYELKDREKIFIFTGPYGSGRKTLADMAGATLGMKEVLSYTTRAPRPGENHGEDYYFISKAQFLVDKEKGEFIECVDYNGNLYGIKNRDLAEMFQKNGFVYAVLNRNAADIIKQVYGDKAIRLFIYADRNTVLQRLMERGDSEDVIEQHIAHYDHEMAYQCECEHSFENFESAHTIFALTNILEPYLERNLVEKD